MGKLFNPEQFELSNGIPVVLQHHDSPVAAIYWWVKTGSADEAPQQAGFAHFLEHMLFKDAAAKESGVASTGQMAQVIESLGGDINAYTSFDQTVYHVTCAAQHWERVLDAFGTMAKPQRFLKEDFEREREVILEELRKNEDSPGRRLFQSLFSSTFQKHPYGRPVIGFAKILKSAKLPQLEDFYRNHYVSDSMGLVLVGPFQSEKGERRKVLLQNLEKHFGSKVLKKKAERKRRRTEEPQLRDTVKWGVENFDVKTPSLTFSFRVPELSHEDLPALDLLTSVLAMGELSRLYQRLFNQTSLVTDISGGLYVPKDSGMIYFQAELESVDHVKAAAEEIFLQLKKIGEEGPMEEELSRVLVNAESERLYATQTADGMAGRLGFLKFIMGDLSFDQNYLDDLRAVDSAMMKEVAKKYFDYRRMSGVVMLPKNEQIDASELEALSTKVFSPAPVRSRSKNLANESTVEKESPLFFRHPSGLRVCYYPRPSSHVFSIHASVLGGLRFELARPIERADTDWGASYMMALTWTKGTKTRNSREIASIIEGSAASLDGFSGRNSVGLQMAGLSRDWNKLSSIFGEVLLHPSFPKEEVDHSRRVAEDAVKGIEDHSSQLCSKLFLETLFEKHPYGRMVYGSQDSLKGISAEKLAAFHRYWIRPERLVISVSGAVRSSALEPWIEQLGDEISKMVSKLEPNDLPSRIESEPGLKAPRWVERALGREQCHIIVGGLGTEVNASDRHVLRVLQTLLGGQSGRLFIELREKKSLAYSVAPISFEGVERGYVGTYIACALQKREEATKGILQVLEKLSSKGPSIQEMKRAKEFFMGRRAMDLQSDSSLAAHYGLEYLYNIPHVSEVNLSKEIRRITAKEVQNACRKYLVEPYMVTSAVG